MSDRIEVHIVFEMTDPQHGTYRDALIFPLDDYAKLKKADLDAAKLERFTRWVDQINAPTPEPEPIEPTTALDQAQETLAVLANQVSEIAQRTQDAIAQATAAVMQAQDNGANVVEPAL